MLNRLILCLACLALALPGRLALAADREPCPMEAAMQELLAAGDLDLSDLPDCCNDAATVAATGQLCPSGVDGVAPPVLAPGTVTRLSLASPTAAPPPWLRAGVFDAPETDLWRPPNHA